LHAYVLASFNPQPTYFANLGLRKYQVDQLFVKDAGQRGWHFDRVTPLSLKLSGTGSKEKEDMYSIFILIQRG
jgi:hypothetical protein